MIYIRTIAVVSICQMFYRACYLVFFVLCGGVLFAQNRGVAPVVGVMLKNNIGAASSGLGAANIVNAYNTYGELSNPASIGFAPNKSSIGLNYNPWVIGVEGGDIFHLNLNGFYKLGDQGGVFLKTGLFDIGQVTLISDNPKNGGTSFQASMFDISATAGYAYAPNSKLSVAVDVKYLYSRYISAYSANNVDYNTTGVIAGDLYVLYKGAQDSGKTYRFDAGFTLANVGQKASYSAQSNSYFIPTYMGVGVAFSKFIKSNTLRFLAEVKKDLVPYAPGVGATTAERTDYQDQGLFDAWGKALGESTIGVNVGGEFVYSDLISIRVGYFNDNFSYYSRDAFTLGLGYVSPFNLGVNFSFWVPGTSYTSSSLFTNMFSVSLTYDMY